MEGEHLWGGNAEELVVVTPGTVGGRTQPEGYEVVRGPSTKTSAGAGVLMPLLK